MGPTIDAKSYVMSTYQFDRRFVLALSFLGSSKYALTLTDREGQIHFRGTALTDKNRDNVSVFLTILSFLMFGERSDIGLDPAFESDSTTGQLTTVVVDGRCFRLSQRIYTLDNMLGRSTKVWIVTSGNERFVMKDSWVQTRGGPNEVDHLKAMLGHEKINDFVPTIVCGGDVTINGERDSTGTYRTHVLGGVRGRRVHRRAVTTPVGEPIINFRSKKELISALMDIVRTHAYLTNELRILHRDISIGNVMLNRRDGHENASGLLIDFDYSEGLEARTKDLVAEGVIWINFANDRANNIADADVDAEIDEDDDIGARERIWTGTPPFMAIEALVNIDKPFQNSPCHDLESLLYVILYLCTYTTGPGQRRRDSPCSITIPLGHWFRKEYVKEIGRTKIGHMTTAEDAIIPKFDNYWSDFVPFVRELIKTCFPINPSLPNQFTHANVLAILERAIAAVRDDDDAEPTSSHSDNVKRARLEGDSILVPPSKKGKFSSSTPFRCAQMTELDFHLCRISFVFVLLPNMCCAIAICS